MSIRAIAMEVYRCQTRVHTLEEQLLQPGNEQRPELLEELRQAKAELKIYRNMIEGRKAQSSAILQNPRPRSGR